MIEDLCSDEERNELIWQFMQPSFDTGNYILGITRRVFHAKYWDTFVRSNGYKSGLMIGGEENKTEFRATKENLRRGTIQAGFGTIQKIGQALDIPRWNRGFIMSPAAKKQMLEQILGRLRRIHKDKTEAVCYYFWDKHIYPGHKNLICKNYKNVQLYVDGEFLRTWLTGEKMPKRKREVRYLRGLKGTVIGMSYHHHTKLNLGYNSYSSVEIGFSLEIQPDPEEDIIEVTESLIKTVDQEVLRQSREAKDQWMQELQLGEYAK
jgi:hypothetical protein